MPTIGTCSICHGPVQTPELWSGDVPPVPKCGRCGATPKNPHGPVIEMQPTASMQQSIGQWRPGSAPDWIRRGQGWKP